ncbi:MAG: phospho-sugar mutase [Sciscionella sp.]
MNEPDRAQPTERAAALRWIAEDPEESDQRQLQRVLAAAMAGEAGAAAELRHHMSPPLTFGTAGLRAPVRAGANGMNVATVIRTSAAVAAWLVRGGRGGGVVVLGRDARTGSERFLTVAAEVFAASGFDVRVLGSALPTPVLAYATRALDAVAGVQVTASHNPPADNGYKLYLQAGTQLVPPADAQIEALIGQVGPARSVPRSAEYTTLGPDLVESYVDSAAAVRRGTRQGIRIALTPMHGVGGATAMAALALAGFTDVHVVAAQAQPDPSFPTVAFPNPEEPGAADLLLELAARIDADLAIALDPDADRCALGFRDAQGWRMLRGDETGALLGEYLLCCAERSGAAAPDWPADPLVATTIVSSSLLGKIAAAHSVRYAESLSGFKWLVRAGDGAGTGLVFAYEEALGSCVDPQRVRDKDGISAAVLGADLAAELAASGADFSTALRRLYRRHGVHRTAAVSLRVTDLGVIALTMARLRAKPPRQLLGLPVECADLAPRTDALRITGAGLRVVIRPSGTEPKLKCYLEIVCEPGTATDELHDPLRPAERLATERMATLRAEVAALLGVDAC